ncbi:ChaN family lipoprotein [Undibacterium sp. TJN19]|uniref:ChaN family lipoprotein n=1 Tax=Undibacterium sp. TJN19 TaxID=3413055 RepID=UPI003BF00D3C
MRAYTNSKPKSAFSLLIAVIAMVATNAYADTVSGKILLLGEVHDNPDGHKQRFEALQKMVQDGWRPAIAMEQFDRETQAALSKAQAECADADCVINAAGGKRWEWPYYRPVIALALQYKLPLLAANVSRSDASQVMREGFKSVLDKASITTYRLDQALPQDLISGQQQAIETGHCGKIPAAMVQSMVNAQVVRDVWMAKILADHASRGVVLLAGNGHVRRDLGVPRWLSASELAGTQVHGYIEPESVQAEATASKIYDATHVIPPHARIDPCEAIKPPAPTERK